jgi:hypothetical protein
MGVCHQTMESMTKLMEESGHFIKCKQSRLSGGGSCKITNNGYYRMNKSSVLIHMLLADSCSSMHHHACLPWGAYPYKEFPGVCHRLQVLPMQWHRGDKRAHLCAQQTESPEFFNNHKIPSRTLLISKYWLISDSSMSNFSLRTFSA